MRSLNSLTWRNLTAHPLRSILTALAITLGVAMVLAAAIVGQAAGRSAAELTEEGPRVDLEVFSRDDTPFDKAILNTLRAYPDVELVSPSLRVQAEGVRPAIPRLTLLGVDPETYQTLHELELANGAFLDGPDTIALPMMIAIDHGLNVGDEVTVAFEGRKLTLTVSGRLGVDRHAIPPYSASTAFVPLEAAQTLRVSENPKGLVDRVQIALRPGADVERVRADLAQAIGPELAVVRAAAAEGVLGNVMLVQAALAVVGLIILLAGGFVILNAFAMTVTGRKREIGALRALGMTRRQVMQTVLTEAGLLGLIGTVAGLVTGLGLAWAVMRVMGTLEDAPFAVPWWGPTTGVLMGLCVTLIAALQPAWRASCVSPVVAARPEAAAVPGWYVRSGGRVGAVLLGLVLAGLAAYGLLGRPDIFAALAVMMVGQAMLLGAAVLLLPGLVEPLTRLVRPLLERRLGTAGRLAADNLSRNKLRAVLTAGALTAGLTIIVATGGLMTAGLKGSISRIRASDHEDGFVTLDLGELVAAQEMTVDNFFQFLTQNDPGFDLNPVAEALAPLVESGVIEVIRYRFLTTPSELSSLPGSPGLFVEPEVYLRIGNFCFFEGDPDSALRWMQRGRAVLLPPIVAERLGVQVGDEIPVQTPHGEVMFTVAGIGGGGFMMTVLPYADAETYYGVTTPSFLGIVVAEGQDVEVALAQVQSAIDPFPRMALMDYDESLDPLLQMIDRLELLLDALLLLAIIVAALGVVNTMVINVAERRREIGLLRAVGATQCQVRQAVVAEAATLGLLAAFVAAGLGLLLLLTYGVLVLPNGTTSLGVPPDWDTIRLTVGSGLRDWGIAALVSLMFGPLVAALAAYYPARQAAAMDVVEATRSERVTLKGTK